MTRLVGWSRSLSELGVGVGDNYHWQPPCRRDTEMGLIAAFSWKTAAASACSLQCGDLLVRDSLYVLL
jgi:hypothetical protein